MMKIKKKIETEDKKFVCDKNIEKLLDETNSLFDKIAKLFNRKVGQMSGNPNDLKGELHACRSNFNYLKNIIRKQK